MELSSHHSSELVWSAAFGVAASLVLFVRATRTWLGPVAGVAGLAALVVGDPGLLDPPAATATAALAVLGLVAATSGERFGRDVAPQVGSVVVVVALGGLFLALPDTELAIRLGGAMVPALVLGFVVCDPSPQRGWALVPIPIVIASSLSAGGRTAAALAGVGCLGLVLAEPVANLTTRPLAHLGGDPVTLAWCGVIQLGIVAVCSRVAPSRPTPVAILVVLAAIAVGAAAVRVRLGRTERSPSRPARRPV